MSPSSAHSSPSSHSSPSHSETLPHPKDILSKPEGIFSQPKDALLLHEDTLLHPEDIPLSQPKDSIMLSSRSEGRNVHIFDSSDPNATIGGLILTNGVTNANLYAMVEIFVIFESEFTLQSEDGIILAKDDNQLQPGNYYIYAAQPFNVNNEVPLVRTISLGTGTRIEAFRDAVRERDRRCVITGQEARTSRNIWRGFMAAHIFPLAYERHWNDHNYSRWISMVPDTGGTINSVQNGLLLRSDIHQLFDFYDFSINPDDNYKIVCFDNFDLHVDSIAGKYLDQRFLDNPQRPVDQLLRWHFRQAVLVNMRGAGEPNFEHDFPPGSDMIGEILKGPKAAERMEFELFNRMATQFEDL